jgi:WD40 repeat protein
MSSFQTLAQRKLAALQQKSRQWQDHAAEREQQQDDEQEHQQRKKIKVAPGEVAVDVGATLVSEDEDIVVSDATAAEQQALAAMFPSSFGAAAKPVADTSSAHNAHARKATPSSKVKLEGAPFTSAAAAASLPMPKKVAVPIAPAALLGGAYDSSDDEDAEMKDANSAAASSSTAAASSSIAAAAMSTDDEEEDDSDAEGLDEDGQPRNPLLRTLPISHEVSLRSNGHTKCVSALTVDRAGGRVLSGGYDYQGKQWDFGGMNETLSAFRTFEPQDGHQVRQLAYSLTGDMFLCITGDPRPKIYTREAVEVCQFVRGDMYIMDQKLTKGHSTAVTSGWWHPSDKQCCVTSGIDGTVRIWDVNRPENNLHVVKPRGVTRGVAITATAFSKDGKIIATACTDGSIHLLKCSKGVDYRDDKILNDAHVKGSETSALLFSNDGHTLFSRGGDATLKQWDIRAFRQPVYLLAGMGNEYPETDMTLSPDEKILVTGTSSREVGVLGGQAVFIDRSTMKPIQRVRMDCQGVVRSLWHAGINQLLFGCSDGAIRLLYSPELSQKGVLMCVSRKAKPKASTDYSASVGAIQTPHALPSMGGGVAGQSRKRAREKIAQAMAPEAPVQGKVGVGGRAAGSQSMPAYHLSKYVQMREDPRAKDPREALLAMDELAKADPTYFGKAYAKTQPKTIFAEVPLEEQQVVLTAEEIALRNKREGETH